MPLTPNNREEHFYKGMVDGSTTLTPNNRREHWYSEIIDAIGSGGGGGGGGLLVTIDLDVDAPAMDKTWKEIYDAFSNGTVVQFISKYINVDSEMIQYGGYNFEGIALNGESEYVIFIKDGESGTLLNFFTTTQNGYPVMSD